MNKLSLQMKNKIIQWMKDNCFLANEYAGGFYAVSLDDIKRYINSLTDEPCKKCGYGYDECVCNIDFKELKENQ